MKFFCFFLFCFFLGGGGNLAMDKHCFQGGVEILRKLELALAGWASWVGYRLNLTDPIT